MKKKFKCLVEGCGHVVRTRTGIAGHILSHHKKKMVLGETFEGTRDVVTNPGRNGPFKARAVTTPRPVISAKTKFIDVPCVLRVSINGLKLQGISLAG